MPPRPSLYCSFCGKPEHQASCLVKGPADVAICERCVGLAVDVVAQQRAERIRRDIDERIEQHRRAVQGPQTKFKLVSDKADSRK